MVLADTIVSIENIIKQEKVTTPWRIQEKLRKNILVIYKALLILLKEGKIDVDVLERNVIIRYKNSSSQAHDQVSYEAKNK